MADGLRHIGQLDWVIKRASAVVSPIAYGFGVVAYLYKTSPRSAGIIDDDAIALPCGGFIGVVAITG